MDIVKIGENGDMAYVFFKRTVRGGNVNKACDICRLEDGKLAERWDVTEHGVQDVEPVNGNSIF